MTTNLLPMTELDLRLFTFSAGTLVTEASTLAANGGGALERIYDDACDVGIAIRSHHTGRLHRFYLEREEMRNGELIAWHLKPVARAGNVTAVTIFND